MRARKRRAPVAEDLSARIFADLLDAHEGDNLGDAVARRVRHLGPKDQALQLGAALGYLTLLVHEIRSRSSSGAVIIRQVRDGLTADIVAGTLPTTQKGK